MTHYDVLGVAPGAATSEVRRAYVALARQHHPDRDGGDDEAMRAINDAWATLSDPDRRATYDLTLRRVPRPTIVPDDGLETPVGDRFADLDDDTPIGGQIVLPRWFALLPVAMFAASLAALMVALLFSSAPAIAMAVALFALSCVMFLMSPFVALLASRRRGLGRRPPMATYLDRILEQHRADAAADVELIEDLLDEARAQPVPRGFRAALAAASERELAVIAEVKRRSPSKGDLAAALDPAALAEGYAGGGAACLSVLTDQQWFGGSAEDLRRAREAVALPVLRKDFTVDPRDVARRRVMGADAVLLIAAALDDHELTDFHAIAGELRLDILVEVHDEAELERAMRVGADLIGVNQRDLVTFEVDTDRAVRVGAVDAGDGVVRVAESGIGGPDDALRLAEAGFHAVLVGEALVRSADPARSVADLRVPRR